ncbi:DUF2255 family protein [Companilactobacillus ginsenosidimutans]|uniref:DUF2255 domain-containing protein n=1 Tax=Companilactobacillus ginsenosidimutans TaxID=1007676 RepID=A0A0H4QKH0_9LACO|nr:DUF2255 family protein [Companilactobacillus ginsenosidimutans]AKP67581.1 hypothetical protein ABM34_08585 [Companilactobacillus ginsenosidimutans]
MSEISKKSWSAEQLKKFSTADDMRISPFYSDGKTYGTPTWIWSVVVDDKLYVRAWNGQNSCWYQSAVQQRAGRMNLASANFEISFKDVADPSLINKVDDAYREKYAGSAYLSPMIQDGPKSTTLNIIPR